MQLGDAFLRKRLSQELSLKPSPLLVPDVLKFIKEAKRGFKYEKALQIQLGVINFCYNPNYKLRNLNVIEALCLLNSLTAEYSGSLSGFV